MHYPRKISRIKKLRKQGFRARMRSTGGRKTLSRQRRRGKHTLSVMK
jgi:large subunit ribosomal protein L34